MQSEKKWFKFCVQADATMQGHQWMYGTEAQARRYCDGMHGHQNLTTWAYAEATEADIERMQLAGKEDIFAVS